jgi:hypothetical protein
MALIQQKITTIKQENSLVITNPQKFILVVKEILLNRINKRIQRVYTLQLYLAIKKTGY